MSQPKTKQINKKFEVQITFEGHYILDENGGEKLIFAQTIQSGEQKDVKYRKCLDPIEIGLLFEGFVRYKFLENLENQIQDFVLLKVKEAMMDYVNESAPKNGLSLLHKLSYMGLKDTYLNGEKGWRQAHKMFKKHSHLDIDKRIELIKENFPNLPPSLVDCFADRDPYMSMPSRLAKLHVVEEELLPEMAEDYRRKIFEGKEMKRVKQLVKKSLTSVLDESDADYYYTQLTKNLDEIFE